MTGIFTGTFAGSAKDVASLEASHNRPAVIWFAARITRALYRGLHRKEATHVK